MICQACTPAHTCLHFTLPNSKVIYSLLAYQAAVWCLLANTVVCYALWACFPTVCLSTCLLSCLPAIPAYICQPMHLFPCQQAQQADGLFSKVNSVGQGFLTWGAITPSVLKSISRGAGDGHIRGGQRFA